ERPISGIIGMIRYNTTAGEFEGYNGAWNALGGGVSNLTTDISFDQSVSVGVIRANPPASGQGNDLEIAASDATGGGPDRGGDIVLTPGLPVGGDREGRIGMNGDIQFGNGTDRRININGAGSGVAGDELRISAGTGGSGNTDGGDLFLVAGNAQGTGNGGDVVVSPGATGSGTEGRFRVNGDFTLNDGTAVSGHVLTTDASGNASWQAAPAASFVGVNSNFSFSTLADREIFIQNSATAGNNLTVRAGNGGTTTGGDLNLNGGDVTV
ncbi:MAG: hypothetical protein HRT61_23415, partial [Ekhidna sp.]|nr:hypothetical protein [Ekhidna sp.]